MSLVLKHTKNIFKGTSTLPVEADNVNFPFTSVFKIFSILIFFIRIIPLVSENLPRLLNQLRNICEEFL